MKKNEKWNKIISVVGSSGSWFYPSQSIHDIDISYDYIGYAHSSSQFFNSIYSILFRIILNTLLMLHLLFLVWYFPMHWIEWISELLANANYRHLNKFKYWTSFLTVWLSPDRRRHQRFENVLLISVLIDCFSYSSFSTISLYLLYMITCYSDTQLSC